MVEGERGGEDGGGGERGEEDGGGREIRIKVVEREEGKMVEGERGEEDGVGRERRGRWWREKEEGKMV